MAGAADPAVQQLPQGRRDRPWRRQSRRWLCRPRAGVRLARSARYVVPGRGQPIVSVCLVTDRRRLAGAGIPSAEACRRLVAQARDAVDAGVGLVQVRGRDLASADLAALVTDLVAVAHGSPPRVGVNDRLEVELGCGAPGGPPRGASISPA